MKDGEKKIKVQIKEFVLHVQLMLKNVEKNHGYVIQMIQEYQEMLILQRMKDVCVKINISTLKIIKIVNNVKMNV